MPIGNGMVRRNSPIELFVLKKVFDISGLYLKNASINRLKTNWTLYLPKYTCLLVKKALMSLISNTLI